MSASMREALADLLSWFDGGPSCYGPWIIKAGKDGVDDSVEAARAALSSPAPDRLSEEERRAVENLRTHQEQCDMDGVMVKVSRQAVDETLAIIDRLSRQPEAEPVGYLYFCTDCESRLSKLENGRCGCGSGRVIDAPHTSPRLDRGKADSAVDRANIAQDIVRQWIGFFDPPPQFNIQQSVVLQELIADAIMRETR